ICAPRRRRRSGLVQLQYTHGQQSEVIAMPDLSQRDPLNRFTGLAGLYARSRPDYPATAIDFILQHCGLRAGALLVDVASGTGLSARRFAACGLRVIGIEPNADMRRQA